MINYGIKFDERYHSQTISSRNTMAKYFKNIIFITSVMIVLVGCSFYGYHHDNSKTHKEFDSMLDKKIQSEQDACNLFPKTAQQVHEYATYAIGRAQRELDAMISLDATKRAFDNTAKAYDMITGKFNTIVGALSVLENVSPEEDIRNASHEEIIRLVNFAIDTFTSKSIYMAFKVYVDKNAKKEKLNEEQRYFLDESMRDFKRIGLDLPDERYQEVQALRKEIEKMALAFEENINHDKSALSVKKADLAGCDEYFIKNLECDANDNYILHSDYPTYKEVSEQCTIESTRKQFYRVFSNRAYPQNVQLLEDIIAKKDELAHKLGFDSYAALDIDDQMAKTPDRAQRFINELTAIASHKMDLELAELKKELPQGVALDEQGRFKPWDLAFIKNCYKKKHFKLNENEVAQYFPVDKTVQGIFDIYQHFLGLEFILKKPSWAWHEDVRVIEVKERDTKMLRGYIFIDLYPRPNKYSHAAHFGVSHAFKIYNPDGSVEKSPLVAMVVANFPRATADRPALLKHGDVETFFHEFGHAMHDVLGVTELQSFAGTAVKRDFVEVPSQMFEEWVFDKQLLKGLSCHYQTGKPLPDLLVDALVSLKRFDSGYFIVRQCMFSSIALDIYKSGASKDTSAIVQRCAQAASPQVYFDPETHMQAAFGHLTGYGAKYYGYMWAKVYALDLFYTIKERGLDKPETGKVFVEKILAKGGSVDPNILLKDYLGREPGQDALLNDLGLRA